MEMTDDGLRALVREFKASVAAEIDRIERLVERLVRELSPRTEQRIAEVETGFANSIGDMSARLHARLDGVDRRVAAHDQRLDGIDQRLGGIDQRLGGIDQRLGGIDQRLGGIDTALATIIDRLGPAAW